MLLYKNRLTSRKDFERVGKFGHFFSRGNVAIKFLENGLSETRIGFVAGLKFSKKAVERNRVKRQLREIFRLCLPEIRSGLDIMVMIRKSGKETVFFEALERDVKYMLKNCKSIRRASNL